MSREWSGFGFDGPNHTNRELQFITGISCDFQKARTSFQRDWMRCSLSDKKSPWKKKLDCRNNTTKAKPNSSQLFWLSGRRVLRLFPSSLLRLDNGSSLASPMSITRSLGGCGSSQTRQRLVDFCSVKYRYQAGTNYSANESPAALVMGTRELSAIKLSSSLNPVANLIPTIWLIRKD